MPDESTSTRDAMKAMWTLFRAARYDESFPAALALANDTHDAEAEWAVGNHYSGGAGVAKDRVEALRWHRLSAEQGYSPAEFSVGFALLIGSGTPVDHAGAVEWFRKSAAQGDGLAQAALGKCYEDGHGVPQDRSEATVWYRLAAEQSFTIAQIKLAEAYEQGIGVVKDLPESVAWLTKAAELNEPTAQLRLARCYARGYGVERDDAKAELWLTRAESSGDPEALAERRARMAPPVVARPAATPWRSRWRLYLLRFTLLAVLFGLGWGSWKMGLWFAVFWAYVLMTLQVMLTRSLAVLVNPDVLAGVVREYRREEFLMSARKAASLLLGTLSLSVFWPVTIIVRFWTAIALYKARQQPTERELRKRFATSDILAETWLAGCAAGVALFLIVFHLPDTVERRTAAIVAVTCTLLLTALALDPEGLAQRLKTSTDYIFTNLVMIAALFFVALGLCYLRLDFGPRAFALRADLWSTTKALLIPGRAWVWPWLAARVDDLTSARFHLSTYLPVSPDAKLTLLQVAEFCSGSAFYASIVVNLLDRQNLKRTKKDILDYVDSLLRLGRFERAAELLNGTELGDRDFRWWLGRALAELGRGDEGHRALGYAEKAAEHYAHFSIQAHAAEPLLYGMAIEFELPDAVFLDRLTDWMRSERCKDEDLWKVVHSAIVRRRAHVVAVVAAHTTRESLPLTAALLACHEWRMSDASSALAKLETHSNEATFERLITEYATLRGTPGAVAMDPWITEHFDEIERVIRLLRSEFMVRVALDWLSRMPDATVGERRRKLVEHLQDQYAAAPGLLDSGYLHARSAAQRFSEKIVRRWPSLRPLGVQ